MVLHEAAAEDKNFEVDQFDSAISKRDQLPNNSPLRLAFDDEVAGDVRAFIANSKANDLLYSKWPPIYSYFASYSFEAIRQLSDDLLSVLAKTKPERHEDAIGFLKLKRNEPAGKWHGGLFETWAKATLAKQQLQSEFDFVLPNRKRPDARIVIDNSYTNLEFTVITDDDESREVFDKYMEAKRNDPNARPLVRPGKYCPPNAKGPSPYYDARRIYAKVYDKICKGLDPTDHQCSDDGPNLLLLSFAGLHQSATNPPVGWALDELFAAQPRSARTPEHLEDITLSGWIDFTAKMMMSSGKMNDHFFCAKWDEMIRAPRKLSGIMLFDGSNYVSARVNYNADSQFAISHARMAEFERLFSVPCSYFR